MRTALIAVLSVGFFGVTTNVALGQGLVPCGIEEACNACHLVELAQNVINFMLTLAGSVAAIMFTYAGFLYLSAQGSSNKISKAHSIFSNVLIGLIVALSAWLVVNAIMNALVDSDGEGFGAWNQIECSSTVSIPEDTDTEDDDGDLVPSEPASDEYSHDEANEQLNSGIGLYSSEDCFRSRDTGCTSLKGIKQNTIDTINAIQSGCDCSFTITGGTELGHADGELSHGNGYKVDIDDSADITNHIVSNPDITRDGERNGSPRFVDANGNEYVLEGADEIDNTYNKQGVHWDITVKQ